MERTEQSLVFVDTHVVLWLYDGKQDKLSNRARSVIEAGDVYTSPMVVLELQYLYEIGRLKYSPHTIIQTLVGDIGLHISAHSFEIIVQYAVMNTWTRDPFDRIIVADAQAANAPLITADKNIQKHYKKALI